MRTELSVLGVGEPLMPEQAPEDARQDAVAWGPNLTVVKGTITGVKTSDNLAYPYANAGTPEIQTITVNATGGTFTTSVIRNGVTATTGALAWNITATALKTALEALINVGTGVLTVGGGPGATAPLTVQFNVPEDVATMTTNAASLTGGAGTAAVAVTQAGSATVTGVERAVGIAMYSFKTDANGKVYFSTTSAVASNENPPFATAPIWYKGTFDPTKLTGLDEAARRDLNVVTQANGFIRIP